jgi:hypothetical protein
MAIDRGICAGEGRDVKVVPLAADERLSAAFARYDAEWAARGEGLITARIELCEALLACSEPLPDGVITQLALDRAALTQQVIPV